MPGRLPSESASWPCQLERYDCEYRRNGTANLFIFLDAHRPWHKVKVTDRRSGDRKTLVAEIAACQDQRNAQADAIGARYRDFDGLTLSPARRSLLDR